MSEGIYMIDISEEPIIGPGSILQQMYLCSRCGALIVSHVRDLNVYELHRQWHQETK